MNSKNKYFKYKGNYYTSKEYIALKNKEIITQSGGSNKNDCESKSKSCKKNEAQQVLGEISNGLSELVNIINYYFKFIQKFCSNKYRVYYIPLTYRYNLTFKNIPWLFTLRSPLFYRSIFSDMQTLNLINEFVYDKKNMEIPHFKTGINIYHTIFKNFQESTDKYIWNEVFEKLFIPLALDAPTSETSSGLGALSQGGASFKDMSAAPEVPVFFGPGSGSIKQNENLLIEINDVTDEDVKKYKRLTRESFNFLLLILQNIALINEKDYLKSTSDKYKKDPTDDDNEKNYKRLITIGNFLKTGVFNLKDNVDTEKIKYIFNIWNNVRTQLKQLIKNKASKYEKIKLYGEKKEGEEDEEEKEEEEDERRIYF